MPEPNSLRVYVEPSIGNRDNTFLQLRHSRLDLTTDVLAYCEAEITKTKSEITDILAKIGLF